MKEKKRELKTSSSYYRIVKQGSVLVYLSFHIFTIFIILLMATMRQSILSLGYVFILLPKIKDAAEVLNLRDIAQSKKTSDLKSKIIELEAEVKEMKVENEYPKKTAIAEEELKTL